MNHIRDAQEKAAAKVRAELDKPLPADEYGGDDTFDPWALFPSLYGSYSQAFDQMALDVLRSLALASADNWDEAIEMQRRETLAHEMFREMLCTAELCDYGSSPRVCFANHDTFAPLLPELIAKWEAYSQVQWGEPAQGSETETAKTDQCC